MHQLMNFVGDLAVACGTVGAAVGILAAGASAKGKDQGGTFAKGAVAGAVAGLVILVGVVLVLAAAIALASASVPSLLRALRAGEEEQKPREAREPE